MCVGMEVEISGMLLSGGGQSEVRRKASANGQLGVWAAFVRSFIRSFVRSFVHSFASFVRSFVRSFASFASFVRLLRSFVCSSIPSFASLLLVLSVVGLSIGQLVGESSHDAMSTCCLAWFGSENSESVAVQLLPLAGTALCGK